MRYDGTRLAAALAGAVIEVSDGVGRRFEMSYKCRLTPLAWVLLASAGLFPGRHSSADAAQPALSQPGAAVFKFDFGAGETAAGYTQVLPTTAYSGEQGYGFEPGSAVESVDRDGDDPLCSDFVTAEHRLLLWVTRLVAIYRVKHTWGPRAGGATTTVKAELRRLMLHRVCTQAGGFETRTIVVNVRTPKITGGGEVRLKGREFTSERPAWDDKLTLEFNDERPCLCAMEVSRADDVPTVYLLGDSTVCDQPVEPWNSWGQMLTRFFKPDVAVANHAESGESLRSSLGAGRVDKIMGQMKAGDYLLVQFGHNDMKDRAADALATYESNLKKLVADTRAKGATPILVTSMERKAGLSGDTLGQYPETVRQVAREDNVALVDLHASSKTFYAALGADLNQAFQDGTHHNNYGSYELAKCVIQGIRDKVPDLAKHVMDDWGRFDPAQPDPVDGFVMPASPEMSMAKPEGN
jgi:lysophospholipase L1-like esterase